MGGVRMTKLYLPKYCILESLIRECEDVSESAKIYFGELAVLASKYNHVPYTDNQLAEMKSVDVRTIKRWHNELERNNFISKETKNKLIETEQCKWKPERKIYIDQNQGLKKCSDRDKNVPFHDRDKNVPFDEGDKNVPIPDKTKDKTKNNNKPAAAAAVFSCLKEKDISEREKEWITKNFQENEVIKAIEFTEHPSTKIKESYIQTLKWACEDQPKIKEIVDPETNHKKARKILQPLNKLDDTWVINVDKQNVEFLPLINIRRNANGRIWGSSTGKGIYFEFSNRSFWNDVLFFVKEKIPSIYLKLQEIP